MDFLGIIGWVFASLFLLLPVAIGVIMVLERDKTTKNTKTDLIEQSGSGIHFTQANTKKPKRGLIAKESKGASKEDIAAGVFGFGKSNGFTLPDAGDYVAPARPDLIAPDNTSEPLHDLPAHATTSKPTVQAPQPLQQAKPVTPLATPPASVRPLLPPPPPSLR
jgi:hypothetical protein